MHGSDHHAPTQRRACLQYDETEVRLTLDANMQGVDLSEYSPSSIWDVVDVPAQLVNDRSRIEYAIKIRHD